jgi:undecaprenyl-diphosphatase
MELLKALILGLVQGLTEFIPISSSGHLVLSKHFLNFSESTDMSFEIFVHLGSMIAVLVFFRREICDLILSVVQYKNPNYSEGRKIVLWLFVATVVTGVFGIVFKEVFETLFNNPLFSAITIGITGFILYFSDKIAEKKLDIAQLNINKSLMIGLAQAIAITPGISRSGTTITAGLLTGLKRKQAATFSFLLSIPAILGAHVTDIKKFLELEDQLFVYLTGFAMAGISGYLVIRWLIKIIEKAKLRYFAYYCWGISIVCIVLLTTMTF